MILGELNGVVSPESWTSECSEGKSLETSGRFRPASESSLLASDMTGERAEGEAHELGRRRVLVEGLSRLSAATRKTVSTLVSLWA